jgi:multidrug transporter EmrE-like cation transporter
LHWLLLSILIDFGFVQLFKYGQRKRLYAPIVVSTNYLTVALSLGIYLAATDQFTISESALRTGLMTGVVFISSMTLMTAVMEFAPVGAVLTAFRMSIAVPVALGVYFWGETITPEQLGGIPLTLVALVLMTSGFGQTTHISKGKAFGFLFAVFCIQGISHSCLRSVHYTGLDNEYLQVLLITGATAGTLGSIRIALQKRRPTRPELALGSFIGLYNALALCIIMITLSKLPGTLFFPAMGCGVVLLDNLAAHFFWKERLNRLASLGVALAVVAIVLVI